MNIKCPSCGVINLTDKPLQPDKRYRCGKCGALIPYLEAIESQTEIGDKATERTSIPDSSTAIPKEGRELHWPSVRKLSGLFSKKWPIMLGIAATIFIAVSIIMTVHANNRVTTAQENGGNEGNAQGYSDGYKEGEAVGYDRGKDEGYSKGDIEGYESGLIAGYEEGEKVGYEIGSKEGYETGSKEGYEIGSEEGYKIGHAVGFKETIGTGYLVRDPTYSEVVDMLSKSDATSAWQINNEFEDEGIRTGFVWVNFAEGGGMGTSLIVFKTVDKGYIFIEPLSHQEIVPEVGTRFSELMGESYRGFDDTMIRITVIW